ncbi:HlyU family transcriptional regulator [Oceanisphaera sp. IT1-181]|uniref:HlyU family transcriptional regulator n=1 Tax=Oceanisphaera sp. IT1-181 TaxID=3081199 RepID=UPI0029C9E7A2|nr:HlyU family transcriptional regulator [Oceanisphaera sp. IT1-181]
MLNWLKKWAFSSPSAPVGSDFAPINYQGYDIHPGPIAEGGQYRINGHITQVIDGTEHSYDLVRADLLPSAEQAAELMIAKAKRVIDEHGNRLFH